MVYKKRYEVKGKIISKSDIINIVQEITKKYESNANLSLKFEAEFSDGTSIEENDYSIFEHSYFEKLYLEKLSIFVKNGYNTEIMIFLYQKNYESSISVEVNNRNLYDSICHCLEEQFKLMKKQKFVYWFAESRFGFVILELSIISIVLLLFSFIDFIFKISISLSIIELFLFLSLILSLYIVREIEKNFPNVQFDFGEASINYPKIKKSWIIAILLYLLCDIFIPILVEKIFGSK